MKYITLTILSIILIACQPPIKASIAPTAAPIHHKPAAYAHPNHVDKRTDSVATVEPEWTITDDRFITTHDIDMSADALQRSKESVQKRLDVLDKSKK